MTITEFVDKWAPAEGQPNRVQFALDVESLLTDQIVKNLGLENLLDAIERDPAPRSQLRFRCSQCGNEHTGPFCAVCAAKRAVGPT